MKNNHKNNKNNTHNNNNNNNNRINNSKIGIQKWSPVTLHT